jgi:hypothetical protein
VNLASTLRETEVNIEVHSWKIGASEQVDLLSSRAPAQKISRQIGVSFSRYGHESRWVVFLQGKATSYDSVIRCANIAPYDRDEPACQAEAPTMSVTI